ncbi:MAG: ester cyclase [Phormidesmis priestleyi]|uniref:Ester cyclase n=1 Tax=Phormidesmis priestleyi TaxID=268141 RepID=A0A2W4XSJ7_9CYAN|nr:MAG: ester cyclase [Phormidesmis priestleyi]
MFHDLLATQNKALVLQFYKSFDNRRLSEALTLLSPDLIAHMSGMDEPLGLAAFDRIGTEVYNAFPDGRHEFSQVIAHRDTVTTCGFFIGTHLGPFQGLPPTGKVIRFAVMHLDRVSYGKIIEHWGQGDRLSLVQQLGVKLVPGPGVLLKLGLKASRHLQQETFARLRAIAQPDYPSQTQTRNRS